MSVTPTDANTTYVMGGMTKEVYAEYAENPASIFEKDKAAWEKSAEWYDGSTWVDIMKNEMVSGAQELDATDVYGAERLAWGTDYVLYFYGVNEEGTMTTAVQVVEFTTLSPVASDTTFEITIDAMTRSSVNFTVTPSSADTQYYVTIQQNGVVEKYNAEDGYAGLASELIMAVGDAVLESRLFTGTQSLKHSDVGASVNGFKNYYIVVFGFENGVTTPVYVSEKFKPADPVVEE